MEAASVERFRDEPDPDVVLMPERITLGGLNRLRAVPELPSVDDDRTPLDVDLGNEDQADFIKDPAQFDDVDQAEADLDDEQTKQLFRQEIAMSDQDTRDGLQLFLDQIGKV